MKRFLLAALTFSTIASAQEVRISYSSSNELLLSAKSCNLLLEQQNNICNIKTQVDGNSNVSLSSCMKKGSNYELKINSCLPSFIKSNLNRPHFRSGPNCWGTALHLKGFSHKPRFVWSNEIVYWQESPLCRKLRPGEKLQPGDILNIYGPEYKFQDEDERNKGRMFWNALYPGRYQESTVNQGYTGFHNLLHSETYISSQLSFGKDSPSKDDKFKFNPLNEVYGRSREKDCQENQNLIPHTREYRNIPRNIRAEKCAYFSQAYRCSSFKEYFNKQALTSEQEQIKKDIEFLYQYQEKLFNFVMNKSISFTQSEITRIVQIADDYAEAAIRELSFKPSDKNTEMLLTMKFFTASGIRKSLELAGLITATEPL